MTRWGSPASRAADYGMRYGIEWMPFWSAPTQRVGEVEAQCHRDLARLRFVNSPLGASEIFHCTPQAARTVAQRHVIAPGALPWRLRLPALSTFWRAATTVFSALFWGAIAAA